MHHASSFRRRIAARLLGATSALALAAQGGACSSKSSPASSVGGSGGSVGSSSRSASSASRSASSSGHGGSASDAGHGGHPSGVPCSGAYDCPCWQCSCAGAHAPVSVPAACVDGVCPSGDLACSPACAALDAGLDGSFNVICPDVAAGGGGGAGGSNGMAGVEACFPTPEAGVCPTNRGTALNDFLALGCPMGFEPYEILSGPTTDPTLGCCYMVHDVLCGAGGRAYRETAEEARVLATTNAPEKASTPSERLARAWVDEGLAEHASVASFARFALSLAGLGAPASLVEAAHQAALDEIHHAELCFAIASRHAGREVAPGPFPLGGVVRLEATLEDLAASTLVDGCLGETSAALLAAERFEHAVDPEARAALEIIAEDEARHAELAWRTVAWALATGGASVRRACEAALARALSSSARVPCAPSPRDDTFARGGIATAGIVAASASYARAVVLGPAARAFALELAA